jgi:uncharacterized protein (TIGR02145 family)
MKSQPIKTFLVLMAIVGFGAGSVNAQQSEFYGMTHEGGEFNMGTIFRTDNYGDNFQVVSSFQATYSEALPVGKLCEANNGKLYGMTGYGGASGCGVIFEWDPVTNIYTRKLDFNGSDNGSYPQGSLFLAGNGKFYGVTEYGGKLDEGVLFEWDPVTNVYIKKLDFSGNETGRLPFGSLIQADNGKMYGTTLMGGTNNCGVLFEWDPVTGVFTKKLDFNGTENGSNSQGTLMQADDGKLYGMTFNGGKNDLGVLFEWDPVTDTYTKKLDFTSETGGNPVGSLMQAINGKLYGATRIYGGNGSNNGTLFQWDPHSNMLTIKHVFDYSPDGEYGYTPLSSLIQGSSSKLYGVTLYGGVRGCGVLFEYDLITDTYTRKFDFNSQENGSYPNFLMQATNSKIYVTTQNGLENEHGAIFEWEPDLNICTKKIGFTVTDNGKNPIGSLTQADNEKLYGMTSHGGAFGYGTLFEFDHVAHTCIDKFSFSRAKGYDQTGSLVRNDNGKLYGITSDGGYDETNNNVHGVLFEWDPAMYTYTIRHYFDVVNGNYPCGSLMRAGNGKLYGMTSGGGTFDDGVIFEFDPATGIYVKKAEFNGTENGKQPNGGLVQAENGKFYGTTGSGGKYTYGILFEWDPETNKIITKQNLYNRFDGSTTIGSMVQAGNGRLFGVTMAGGAYNLGVFFEYDYINGKFFKQRDFSENGMGAKPCGSLIFSDDGKLYGMTSQGGLYNSGVLFEWDPAKNFFTKKYDFYGSTPSGSLVEVIRNDLVSDTDGNVYKTVHIGNQTWMAENLKTARLNDGALIPMVSDNTEWSNVNASARCWYNNDSVNNRLYGALYNYYAVETKKLCPVGWHVPEDGEWNLLRRFLGDSVAGVKLKESGPVHWPYPNLGANNSSGFSAIPGSLRSDHGGFIGNNLAAWWSATSLQYWYVTAESGDLLHNNTTAQGGLSIRCINDTSYAIIPKITTKTISHISKNSAVSGGSIRFDGGSSIMRKGICWSTSHNPDTTCSRTIESSGSHNFISNIGGLAPNTTYYVRSYAINNAGIGYGNEISLITFPDLDYGTVTDIDGNDYNTIPIGRQIWMAENLRTTKHADGTPIKNGTLYPVHSENDSCYYIYENNSENIDSYGLLYTWDAAVHYGHSSVNSNGFSQGACPTGWHIPSRIEEMELIGYLGGKEIAGGKLKEAGSVHWNQPNKDATNESGFTARGAGIRKHEWFGDYYYDTGLGSQATFWTLEAQIGPEGYIIYTINLSSENSSVTGTMSEIRQGFSVRCLNDSYLGKDIPDLFIDQTYDVSQNTAQVYCVITYNGGTEITERGLCWSTSSNPDTSDNKIIDGEGNGIYTTRLAGLLAGTNYFLRAYAINSNGVYFSPERNIKTLNEISYGSVTDVE